MDIVELNVGGRRFSTSRATLLSEPDAAAGTFFASLLSGRMASMRDAAGAFFVDRDPEPFARILGYLRTRQLHPLVSAPDADVDAVIHEAKFYGIASLVKQLTMCRDVESPTACGNILFCGRLEPGRGAGAPVRLVAAHLNTVVVAYDTFFACYQHKGILGFVEVASERTFDDTIADVAVHVRMSLSIHDQQVNTVVAVAHKSTVSLCGFGESGGTEVALGTFRLPSDIGRVFYAGSDLVALSADHVGVWRSQQWQSRHVDPIRSHDVGGSFLLLGSESGSIHYIDMEKFPLRMKDNDLLVSELFRDPASPDEAITAMSVYSPSSKAASSKVCGNGMEIAYGTSRGNVRVIVQYPETVGQGPQLYQTFSVHTSAVVDVLLSEKYLVSVCESRHVRTWSLTRFRGMISTYPGSTVLASFNLVDVDGPDSGFRRQRPSSAAGHCDEPIFVQRLASDEAVLRQAANGTRLCRIRSVDSSAFSAFCVHDCEVATSRTGSGPSSLLISGHSNGTVQMWDMATALKPATTDGSLGQVTAAEMARLIDTSNNLQV